MASERGGIARSRGMAAWREDWGVADVERRRRGRRKEKWKWERRVEEEINDILSF